jgi:hypothetical protein
MLTLINCPKCNEELQVPNISIVGSVLIPCSKRHKIQYKCKNKALTLVPRKSRSAQPRY